MVRCALLVAGFVSVAVLAVPARAEILIGVAGPLTGKEAWFGEQLQRASDLAVADLNAAGGVLGEPVRVVMADDFCDPEQAVAAAKKLVGHGVIFGSGHYCSHAAIPASEVYEAAGALFISPTAINPLLTELGRSNVFRVIPRDDADALMAADYLAGHWGEAKIAILHDHTTWDEGIAAATRKQLHERGVSEALYDAYVPGATDYVPVIERLRSAAIDVVFIGGYHAEVGLIARAARDRGYPLQLVVGPSLASEEFGLIAGDAAEGTLFTFLADPRRNPAAAPVVARFRAAGFEPEGYTLYAYAAVQVWAEAAAKAGTLDLQTMIATLRDNEFESVLGPIDFDDKGDVTTQTPIWHVWRGGTYVPLDDAPAAGE